MLETTPVARPVIYTLIGCGANERCVIERTETGFVTREDDTCTANDWVPPRPGWEGRIGTRRFLVSSFDEARATAGGGATRWRLERLGGGRRLRLDQRAGAQSLHAACGGDVSGAGILRVAGYDLPVRRCRSG